MIASREVWVTLLRAYARRNGVVLAAGPLGKAKMVLQVGVVLALITFDLSGVALYLPLYAMVALTVASGVEIAAAGPAAHGSRRRARSARRRGRPLAARSEAPKSRVRRMIASGTRRLKPTVTPDAAIPHSPLGTAPPGAGADDVMIVPADGCAEAPGPGRLSRVWPAVAPSVAEARTAVSAFAEAAGATADALAAVSLAVSEAVTNAVLHAYLDHDQPGPVEVRARCEAEKVVVEVADEGRGMLPRTDSPGLGLGLPLIAQMTESLEVHDRAGGGTEIRMAFALAATG